MTATPRGSRIGAVAALALALGLASPASAQPSPGPPPAPGRVSVQIHRAVGGFEAGVLRRLLHLHAVRCQDRAATGEVRLKLWLHDRGDRRGMRIRSATGARRLRRCLQRFLPAARWPTGQLDGIAQFDVTISVTP